MSRKFSFEKYVRQPQDELVLDDSLFDRLYEIDTIVRGTFGLYMPKEPAKLASIWSVGADIAATELLAHLEMADSQLSTDGLNYSKQLDHLLELDLQFQKRGQPALAQQSQSSDLLLLEEAMCMNHLDHVSAMVTNQMQQMSTMVDHYATYVQIFEATYGRTPTILCTPELDSDLVTQFELAGCATLISPLAKLSQTATTVDAVCVSLDQDAALSRALDLHYLLRGEYLPAQCCNTIGLGRTNATLLTENRCTPMLQTSLHKERDLGDESGLSSSSINLLGQLWAGQLIATRLRWATSIPLHSVEDTVLDPAVQELLHDWSVTGYGVPPLEVEGGRTIRKFGSKLIRRTQHPCPPKRPAMRLLACNPYCRVTYRAYVFATPCAI